MKRPRLHKALDQGHTEFTSCKGQHSRWTLVILGPWPHREPRGRRLLDHNARIVDVQNLRDAPEEVACRNTTWLHRKQSKNVLQCFFCNLGYYHYSFQEKNVFLNLQSIARVLVSICQLPQRPSVPGVGTQEALPKAHPGEAGCGFLLLSVFVCLFVLVF